MGSAIDDPGRLGMPIAGMDDEAVEVAMTLFRDIGFVPVVVGDWQSANLLHPGGPFSGELSPEEIREIVESMK
jgi:predicted dinucleotide-binding enzyme